MAEKILVVDDEITLQETLAYNLKRQGYEAWSRAGFAAEPPAPGRAEFEAAHPEAVRLENERPGTRDWILQKTRVDPATKYRCPWIEGYCSRTSVQAGETIRFHVSTNPPSPFTIDLYRMGFYGGAGGRHVMS